MGPTSDNKRIILVEPQCVGFEHAHFNAALLDTVLLAYSKMSVCFIGEGEHVEWVRKALARYDASVAPKVEWRAISIPSARRQGYPRLRKEWSFFSYVLRSVITQQAHSLIFCSINNTQLFALKIGLYQWRPNFPVIVIPHGILSSIMARQSRQPWHWAFGLRQVLRLPHPRGLRYIALGEPIYRELKQIMPRTVVRFAVLDPPCFWKKQVGKIAEHSANIIRFGHCGTANAQKGFDAFVRLATIVSCRADNSRFVLAGFVNMPGAYSNAGLNIEGVGYTPLLPEEYARRVSSLTYIIGLSAPAHYRLVASATFLDALSFLKPGIYLRNPYVEYYFEQMGDIGYLCENTEEVQATVLTLARSFPIVRYQQQRGNILRGRRIFDPHVLASQLKSLTSL